MNLKNFSDVNDNESSEGQFSLPESVRKFFIQQKVAFGISGRFFSSKVYEFCDSELPLGSRFLIATRPNIFG